MRTVPTDTRNIKRSRVGSYTGIYDRDKINTNGYSSRYTSGTANRTNAAYDLTPYGTSVEVAPKRKEAVKKPSAPAHRANAVIDKNKMRRIATASVIVFIAAMVILCRYVSILNGNRTISELEKQYSEVMSQNQAMQVKIDGKLEKGEIEKTAREELGMMAPENYQVFYIQMDMQDGGDGQSENKSDDAVLGTPGTLMNAFRVLK